MLTRNFTARQLVKDLNHAKKQYIEKRDHFIGLCELNESRVVAWSAMDRSPRVDPRNKRSVISVYEHNHEKGELLDNLLSFIQSNDFCSTNPQSARGQVDVVERYDYC